MTRISLKLNRKHKKADKSIERFHSLQLWWSVVVAFALGISYVIDANKVQTYPKTAQRQKPLFERLPAQDETTR